MKNKPVNHFIRPIFQHTHKNPPNKNKRGFSALYRLALKCPASKAIPIIRIIKNKNYKK